MRGTSRLVGLPLRRHRRLHLGAFSAALALLTGCSDLSLEPSGGLPAQLSLNVDTLVLTEGESVPISYELIDSRGYVIPVASWAEARWRVQSSLVAEVEAGAVRAVGPGETRVTAIVAKLSSTAVLRVNPREMQMNVSNFYLTQSVQRPDGSVPLVTGRDALLRVFLTADRINFFRPGVRVLLYREGHLVRTLPVQAGSFAVPRSLSEGNLSQSWNVLIPGELIQPGLSVAIEADPDGVVPLSAGSSTRLPASGALALDVRDVPPLWLRVVPVRLTRQETTGRVEQDNLQEFLKPTLAKFPLHSIEADLRSLYASNADLTTDTGWSQLLREIATLAVTDGSKRYYYGVHTSPQGAPWGGLGYVGWPAAIGHDEPEGNRGAETMAHELGHNFGLLHAPCGGPANSDPSFPYAQGGIGVYGYDLLSGEVNDPSVARDLMSYCSPAWISDYNYEKVLAFRELWDWHSTGPDAAGDAEPSLLVWGGVEDGRLVLEPSFEFPMKASLPGEAGPYRISGFSTSGERLFSYAFQPMDVDHEESRHFAFAIPARLARSASLSRIEFTGPEGTAAQVRRPPLLQPTLLAERNGRSALLSWPGGEYPMALVRDADTGEVLSFARGGVVEVRAPGRRIEVLLSDGVRNVRPAVVER